MAIRTAEATWNGDLKSGKGQVSSESGALDAAYSFGSRFEDGTGTNPEELLAAAHAGCYAMALANALAGDGHEPERVHATAKVRLGKNPEGGFHIPSIQLIVEAEVPGIDYDTFMKHAEQMKEDCLVSKVLSAAEISLEAKLAN